jgi:hypothetical protein
MQRHFPISPNTFHTEQGLPRANRGKVELVEIRGIGVVGRMGGGTALRELREKRRGKKDVFVSSKRVRPADRAGSDVIPGRGGW